MTSGGSSGTGGKEALSDIHYLGRFDRSNPESPAFSWPGTAIVTRFSGTGLDVNLHDDGHNFFAVSIDGAAPTVLATSNAKDTYSLAQGLPQGEHDAMLFRRTESFQGIVHFHGFSVAGGAPLIPTPAPFKRHVEVIGDSITCGYGNDGVGPNCGFTAQTENGWLAYGSVAARALKAEVRLMAYSGKGVYRDGANDTTNQMPVMYERTFADLPESTWDFSAWTADVVVVNLGTNDFVVGDPGQPYVDAYSALIKQIRGHYPQAYIVCAVGSMMIGPGLAQCTNYVKSVVSAANAGGDSRVSFVDLGVQDGIVDGYGCDYHPSAKTDQLMADKLTAAISAVAGW
jgi:lysophospholipase L1-like esterase